MDEKKPETEPSRKIKIAGNSAAITEALRKAAIRARLEREMHEKLRERLASVDGAPHTNGL